MHDELLSIQATCQRLGLSRAYLYEALLGKRLPSVKIGRRRLVRASDVDALISALAAEAAEARQVAL